jgi:phage-related protein
MKEKEFVEFAIKYERLTKIQKSLINKLLDSSRTGNYHEIISACMPNTNNQAIYSKQIKKLADMGIITITKSDEKKRSMEFALTKNWCDALLSYDFGATTNNRFQY